MSKATTTILAILFIIIYLAEFRANPNARLNIR